MSLLFLLGAIIGSSSLVIILKSFDLKGVDLYIGITVNYIVGALLSFAFSPVHLSLGELFSAPWFFFALLTGVMFMIAFVVYGISAQRSGVAITTISGRAAVFIPVVFAFLALGEKPTLLKISMLAVILVAMVMILYRGKTPGTVKASAFVLVLLPLLVMLSNGASDTMVQFAQREKLPAGGGDLYFLFNGSIFLGGAISGLIVCLIDRARKHDFRLPRLREIGWGGLLGAMNWICMIGVLYSLTYFEGSVFYPLYYTGAIVISTIVGVWIFKERLSALNWIGVVLAIAAIAVLGTL